MISLPLAKIRSAFISPLAMIDFRYAVKTGTAIALPFMILAGYRHGYLCTDGLVGMVMLFGVAACLMGEVSRRQWRQFFSLPVIWALLGFLSLLYFQGFFRMGMGYHPGELLLPIGYLASSCWLFFYLQDRKNLELFTSAMVIIFTTFAAPALLGSAFFYVLTSKLVGADSWLSAIYPFLTPFLTINSVAAPIIGAPIFLACLYWRRAKSQGKVSELFKYSTAIGVFAASYLFALTGVKTHNFGPTVLLIGLGSTLFLYLLRVAYGRWVAVAIALIGIVGLLLVSYAWFSSINLGDFSSSHGREVSAYKEIGPFRGKVWGCAMFNAFTDPLALRVPLGLISLCSEYWGLAGHGNLFMLFNAGGWVLVSLLVLTILTFTFYWLFAAHRPFVWLVLWAVGIFVGTLPLLLHWGTDLGISGFFGGGFYFLAIVSALVLAINRELASPLTTVSENRASARAS